jgi:hypothetical protein
VAGLGSTFDSFIDKTIAFEKQLSSDERFGDDDCVVVFDAYDVILTPAIRRICEVLYNESQKYYGL